MCAACGVIMVRLVRNFLADYDTGSLRLSFPPHRLRSGRDEEGFFSCKMNGLYRELQAFIRCLRASPTHDRIFVFCRAALRSVGRANPGRAFSPRDARCSDARGPAIAVLDAGAGNLARAPARLARGGARRRRRSRRSARARRRAAFRARCSEEPRGRSERRAQQPEHDADRRRRACDRRLRARHRARTAGGGFLFGRRGLSRRASRHGGTRSYRERPKRRARSGVHEGRRERRGRGCRPSASDRSGGRQRPATRRPAAAATAARQTGIPQPGPDRAQPRRRIPGAPGPSGEPVREARPAPGRRDQERQRPAAHQHGRRDASLPAVRHRPAGARGRAAPGPQRDAVLRYALTGAPRNFLPTLMRKTPIDARILCVALALAAHTASGQTPEVPGAPPVAPGAPTVTPGAATVTPGAPPVQSPAPAARTPGASAIAVNPRAGEVVLNFQGADLQAVVKAMSQMTGRNMLIDPRVRGQVTIVSARPMPVAAGYQIFLSALKTQGFTAVEGPGDAVRIIPVAEAKAAAPVNEQDGPPRGGEQVVTHVVIGQHVAVAQLQNVLRPLMSPTSQLSVYDPANALIITDYADNVRRLLRIIERIDQPASTDVTVIPVQHASAIDLAELVVRLSGTGVATPGAVPGVPPTQIAAGGDRFSVVPDGRTNSILLRSDNPGRIALLRSLIERLDVPARAIGSTRVIYLKHAEATKLVEVLRGMLAAAATGAPGQTAAPGGRPGGAAPSLIQADEATNSIIINASDTVYNNLRLVIEQLDVRRAQVYVEALVAEMNADRSDELGFQWAGARGVGSRAVGAAANFPSANPSIVGLATGVEPIGAGLSVAMLGSTITLPDGTTVRGLGALARALQSNNLGNILSTPNLLTLDNYQAKIVIGQNVPFVTGSFATPTAADGGAGPVNPFQTIERKDVGLTLRIKPQISEGSTIRLEIYQEVADVAKTVVGIGASDLITNKRSLETKVVVDDGQTVVLGGLIQNTLSVTTQQIPLLGDIPFLGALFRFKSEERKRTNLMIFLRPVIIRTVEDGYRVKQDRYEYLRGYTRGEGPEREDIYDRMEPAQPGPPAAPPPQTPEQNPPGPPSSPPAAPGVPSARTPNSPEAVPREPDAGAAPAPAQ